MDDCGMPEWIPQGGHSSIGLGAAGSAPQWGGAPEATSGAFYHLVSAVG